MAQDHDCDNGRGHGHGHGHDHDHGAAVERFDHGHGCCIASDLDHEGNRRTKANTDLLEASANQRKLKRATAFVLVFFVVEVIGGIWSGSLAIVSDAAHLLTDVSGFILAIVANEIATHPACDKFTYGPVRAEVLSALLSTVAILALSLLLIYSAVWRIIDLSRGEGEEVDGKMMSFIAALGLFVNLALLGLLGHDHGGHGHDHSHSHSHAHDGHQDRENGGHDRKHDEDLMETGALTNRGAEYQGADEGTSLVQNASINHSSSDQISDSSAAATAATTAAAAATAAFSEQRRYGSVVVDGVDEVRASEGLEKRLSAKEKEGEGGRKKNARNINMEAAVLHAVTDLVQSVGVLIAGLLIWYDPRFKWADPIATILFVGLVMNSTRWLLQRAFNVLLEGVPDTIDYDRLKDRLSSIDGVTNVHCLHVWSLTLGRTVVSAHIKATQPQRVLSAAHGICEEMGVGHSTIQVQVDHCQPANCSHPCVSSVGKCCE